MRAAEEELLARVRDALGAKHVIRVCSSYDQARARASGVVYGRGTVERTAG